MIVVENLYKRYHRLEVLRGVSMEVKQGEVAVVVGPSGGGKSTFLRCINGMETFQSGTVTVGDQVLTAGEKAGGASRRLRELRRRVGMVFQQFNLFPHMTVLGNVMEGPRQVLGASRDKAAETAMRLLDRVGLADKVDSKPAQLSGGQQQRVAIARALAMQPEAILFDEPTSALDPRMTAEVLAVMADLAKSNLTMIVVTHAMGFARRAATTVHVFQAGGILESGPPAQIFENPREPATREFLREAEAA
ncbi:MAG: amino acid ABC transporter ATP-binding protein [Planctomycetia bacterium]